MTDRCESFLERLGAYLDGELDAKAAGEMADHLQSCPDCRRARERILAADRLVRESVTVEANRSRAGRTSDGATARAGCARNPIRHGRAASADGSRKADEGPWERFIAWIPLPPAQARAGLGGRIGGCDRGRSPRHPSRHARAASSRPSPFGGRRPSRLLRRGIGRKLRTIRKGASSGPRAKEAVPPSPPGGSFPRRSPELSSASRKRLEPAAGPAEGGGVCAAGPGNRPPMRRMDGLPRRRYRSRHAADFRRSRRDLRPRRVDRQTSAPPSADESPCQRRRRRAPPRRRPHRRRRTNSLSRRRPSHCRETNRKTRWTSRLRRRNHGRPRRQARGA